MSPSVTHMQYARVVSQEAGHSHCGGADDPGDAGNSQSQFGGSAGSVTCRCRIRCSNSTQRAPRKRRPRHRQMFGSTLLCWICFRLAVTRHVLGQACLLGSAQTDETVIEAAVAGDYCRWVATGPVSLALSQRCTEINGALSAFEVSLP